jgi:hypothetical protein
MDGVGAILLQAYNINTEYLSGILEKFTIFAPL